MTPTDEAALQIYQSTRGNRLLCEALLDECFAPSDYVETMDKIHSAMSEDVMSSEGYETFDIGHLTSGIRMNAADVCDAFWKGRRSEFGEQEIRDIRESVLGLWTLLREIEKMEAA